MSLGFVAAPEPADGAPAGTLALTVRRAGQRSVAEQTAFNGVLRLMKPHYLDDTHQVTYIVVNPGGAYFGENYELDVTVRDAASLVFTTQSATRVHRTPNAPAVQRMRLRLEGSARLEYLPDSLIAYTDASYRQFTEIVVDPQATLFLGEILTPGWHPDGEEFRYSDIHLRTSVRDPGGPVCVDNVRLRPETDPIAGIGQLEGFTHLASVFLLGSHLDEKYVDALRDTVADSEAARTGQVGVTSGQRHRSRWAMVRAVANSTDELRELTMAVNTLDRQHTTDQGPLDLRRY